MTSYSILPSECKQPGELFEIHRIGFRGNKKHTKRLATNPHIVCNIHLDKPVYLIPKQNFFRYFDAGLEHMAARPRGNGTNFDWLR